MAAEDDVESLEVYATGRDEVDWNLAMGMTEEDSVTVGARLMMGEGALTSCMCVAKSRIGIAPLPTPTSALSTYQINGVVQLNIGCG